MFGMKRSVHVLLLVSLWIQASPAIAFLSNGRWSFTATDGVTSPLGTSVNVTWSIVPDGTAIPGEGGSDLVSFLDSAFGSGGGADLTQRPWFTFFEHSFERWNELSGLNFIYEPADDGVALRGLGGIVGIRGDVRMGGAFLDGNGGTLASTGFLNDADITIDTGDDNYYGNSNPNNTYQNFHNTLMHEIGHAFGLGHIESTSLFLMEPFTNAAINGPQLDDIRGIHYLYGDINESANDGGGNNTIINATNLGVVALGENVAKGTHAATGTFVLPEEADFLSISNQNDVDYFSFEITSSSLLDLVVTPLGPNYTERLGSSGPYTTTMSGAVSNLSLELYAIVEGNPLLLASANSNPIGQAESILDFTLTDPGQYYFRIAGSTSVIQLYQFSLSVEEIDLPVPGDFDGDGDVDGADFLSWQRGQSPSPLSSTDLALWQENYGAVQNIGAIEVVPEPDCQIVCLSLLTVFAFQRKAII